MKKQRENWLDFVKGYACILVVLGHLIQSMFLSNVLPRSFVPVWLVQTVYYFHVPLFFICSGYLYQRYSCVVTFSQWKTNFLKKLLSLGIPFVAFAGFTWALKVLLPGEVNTEATGLLQSLFVHPISPYWYLYALFFVFIVTPTFKSPKMATVCLAISVAMKGLSFLNLEINFYPLSTLLQNHIWFVIGMNLQMFQFVEKTQHKKWLATGLVLGVLFLAFSIVLTHYGIDNLAISFLMGLMGCFATLLVFTRCQESAFIKRVSLWLSNYTLPIYLMHTIFAAGIRSVLFKLGVTNSLLHIVVGLMLSFAGPMVAAFVMSKIKYMDFFLCPTKYIKIGGEKNG